MDTQTVSLSTESSLPDSITCGQCKLKFYHVSSFLKHKSSCPGNETENSTEDNCCSSNNNTGKEIIIVKNHKNLASFKITLLVEVFW